MEVTFVENAEALYRAVSANSEHYELISGGLRVSSSAFNDRWRKPSVDRSAFRADPKYTRKKETDGVTRLRASEVRSICDLRVEPNSRENRSTYCVDVVHRPVTAKGSQPENVAHCQVECAPDLSSDAHFRKLKEALAIIATANGFVVMPKLTDET